MEKKHSLILDNEFIRYCELNDIEDVEKLAKETFQRGFTLLKYGEVPSKQQIIDNGIPIKPISKTTTAKTEVKLTKKEDVTDTKPPSKVDVPKELENPVKSSGNDLYDE